MFVPAWRQSLSPARSHHVRCPGGSIELLCIGDVYLHREDERRGTGGIGPLAVTGNHDTRVLPRLAERLDGFRLLGAGGQWEAADVAGADGERLRLLGWSLPELGVRAGPLARDWERHVLVYTHHVLASVDTHYLPLVRYCPMN